MTLFTAARLLLLAGSGLSAVRRFAESRPSSPAAPRGPSALRLARQGLSDGSMVTSGKAGGAMRQAASEAFRAARMRRTSPALAAAVVGFAVWRAAAAFMARGRR